MVNRVELNIYKYKFTLTITTVKTVELNIYKNKCNLNYKCCQNSRVKYI